MTKFLTKKEAAEILGISVRSIDYFRVKGNLPSHVIPGGTAVRFIESEIRQWMGLAPEPTDADAGKQEGGNNG